MPRLADLAKPLAMKATEFLTSMRLSIALGVVALVAILDFQLTGEHPVLMAILTLGWALHFAVLSTIDICKKGGEL